MGIYELAALAMPVLLLWGCLRIMTGASAKPPTTFTRKELL
jgi:hypothetical protein